MHDLSAHAAARNNTRTVWPLRAVRYCNPTQQVLRRTFPFLSLSPLGEHLIHFFLISFLRHKTRFLCHTQLQRAYNRCEYGTAAISLTCTPDYERA